MCSLLAMFVAERQDEYLHEEGQHQLILVAELLTRYVSMDGTTKGENLWTLFGAFGELVENVSKDVRVRDFWRKSLETALQDLRRRSPGLRVPLH